MNDRIASLFERIYTPIAELRCEGWATDEPLPFERRTEGKPVSGADGASWGGPFGCAWFHFTTVIPSEYPLDSLVVLLDVGGEGLVYTDDGIPRKGMTNVRSEFTLALGKPGKQVLADLKPFCTENRLSFWCDCAANDLFGNYADEGKLVRRQLAVRREDIRALYYDLEVLDCLRENSTDDAPALEALVTQALDAAEPNTPDAIASARALTAARLAEPSTDSFALTAIGHAHIDLAWLWPIRETLRKGGRTVATALRNMERYPDYVFGASQPQLYVWIREHYPVLYQGIRTAHAAGRWETQGIFWVECDTNIPTGESLIRQALYGKRFFREEFGDDEEICWIPDVFGYSAQLPQIIRGSGASYFLTTKMSWNTVNRFPYSSFNWVGLDGSTVLAHLPPEGNYNSPASPRAALEIEQNCAEKEISPKACMLFGIGDGGGGPGMEHLERLSREKNLRGLPRITQQKSLDFFRSLAADQASLPSWHGELYLEKHQGTYTTHAKSKQNNRQCELALRDAELFGWIALRFAGFTYPKAALDDVWREVLLYQFHDILPGSAIKRVYNETDTRYAALLDSIRTVQTQAVSAIASAPDENTVWFNPTSYARDELCLTPDGFRRLRAEPFAAATVSLPLETVSAAADTLENAFVRVCFAKDGSIVSLIDKKSGFELLTGPANRYAVYPDSENAWEVPDFKPETAEFFTLASTSFRSEGAFAAVVQEYTFGSSSLHAEITLRGDSPRVEIACTVNWQEKSKMLRAAFPVDVLAENAACGIQYGHIYRPTHQNTSWDRAKKEVCFQRWADVSDAGHGLALLCGTKYGLRVRNAVLDLNLLRQTNCPCEKTDTDLGTQTFTYALLPHGAGLHEVIREAELFEHPMLPLSRLPFHGSLFALSAENAVIDWVKPAEDGRSCTVRLYENEGRAGNTALRINPACGFTAYRLTNLIEEGGKSEILPSDGVPLTLRPFGIITVILT